MAQSVHIMLELPQAAQLSIYICERKSVLLQLLEGPDIGPRQRKRRKKTEHPAGIEPTTSRVLLCSRVLYLCATTAAQLPLILLLRC